MAAIAKVGMVTCMESKCKYHSHLISIHCTLLQVRGRNSAGRGDPISTSAVPGEECPTPTRKLLLTSLYCGY